MLTLEAPVSASMVPDPSAAKVFTTQLAGKPLIGTGGPKKQFASPWHDPGMLPQSASVVQAWAGNCTQCLVASGPREQSRFPVPKLAVRLVPSVLKIVVAFSGIWLGATLAAPPPM